MNRLSSFWCYNEITKEIKNSLNKIRVAPKNSQRPRAQKGTEMIIEIPMGDMPKNATKQYLKMNPVVSIADLDSKEICVPKRILDSHLVDKHSKRMYDYVVSRFPNYKIVAA